MSYLETRSEIYASLASALLQQHAADPTSGFRERAFEVVERSRARTLLDVLSIAEETPDPVGLAGVLATLDSREVRSRVLEPGEILLEYTLGESKSILWALTRDHLQTFELPPRRQIETLVGSFLQTLRSPPRAPLNPFTRHLALARTLFEMLLGPVADRLSDEPHIVIVADGVLHHLPFEALAADTSAARPVYLAERAVVSYVPSASVLGHLRRRPRPTAHSFDFLGVAQPGGTGFVVTSQTDLDAAGSTPIPFASVEVERVAELFPEPRRRTYLGSEANESSIKALDLERFRILHFAAHAMTDEVFPARSAILLGSDSDREDGLLRMDEVLALDLSSELVVLSGCETGVGQLLRAEGTLGFTWAFLSAGSSAIVASQWSVNDRSTAQIMEAFYSEMSHGLSPTAALRAAKLAMLDSERVAFRHPYYWAPFVLVGAGS
jgi:CHAT domain-containing protein